MPVEQSVPRRPGVKAFLDQQNLIFIYSPLYIILLPSHTSLYWPVDPPVWLHAFIFYVFIEAELSTGQIHNITL